MTFVRSSNNCRAQQGAPKQACKSFSAESWPWGPHTCEAAIFRAFRSFLPSPSVLSQLQKMRSRGGSSRFISKCCVFIHSVERFVAMGFRAHPVSCAPQAMNMAPYVSQGVEIFFWKGLRELM